MSISVNSFYAGESMNQFTYILIPYQIEDMETKKLAKSGTRKMRKEK
jgi:hypothetical protein